MRLVLYIYTFIMPKSVAKQMNNRKSCRIQTMVTIEYTTWHRSIITDKRILYTSNIIYNVYGYNNV